MDQPYMTFQIIRLIQLNYRQCMSEKMKKKMSGMKSPSNRRPVMARGRRHR